MITVTELLQPVETDLETLLGDLRNLIGAGIPSFKLRRNICSVRAVNASAPALFY